MATTTAVNKSGRCDLRKCCKESMTIETLSIAIPKTGTGSKVVTKSRIFLISGSEKASGPQ